MIEAGPKRLSSTGRFNFCIRNHFGQIEQVGYCRKYALEGNKDGHHATAKEAAYCFMEYLINHAKFDGMNTTAMPCLYCGEKTFYTAVLQEEHTGMVIFNPSLCKPHCNIQTLEKVILKSEVTVSYPEASDDDQDDPKRFMLS